MPLFRATQRFEQIDDFPTEAPHLHINNVNACHSRLKQWLSRFNGVATKNLPNYLSWRSALEAWADQTTPENCIKCAIGNGPCQKLTLSEHKNERPHAIRKPNSVAFEEPGDVISIDILSNRPPAGVSINHSDAARPSRILVGIQMSDVVRSTDWR